MKPLYLSLGIVLWFIACSSPQAKKTTQEVIPKKDTGITTSSSSQHYEPPPVLFIDSNVTVPPYGFDKVKELITQIKWQDDSLDEMRGTIVLNGKDYASLSFGEKFTYHMIHPESYSQNCNAMPERMDLDKRIYGQLHDLFGEFHWSERQLSFFKDNRDTVLQLIKTLIEENHKVGENFMEVIDEMNAKELIPSIIDCYNKQENKDHYILTLLLLLMKQNEYPEFMNSISYKKLYTLKEDTYTAYLVYNQANEDLIIKRAMNFYNSLSAK